MSEPRHTAIVTGAARRIGRMLAEALVARGWDVIAHVRTADDAGPAGCRTVAGDLADEATAARLFEAAGGPIRLLVNSAARFSPDSLAAPDSQELAAHMAVNVAAPARLIAQMARRHGGGDALVVNLLDAKLAAPNPDYLSYSLSKAALAMLGEMAARALAGSGIRVNAIAPALVLPSGPQDEAAFEKVHALNPLGRGVEPEDIVAALDYLLASERVTGETLLIDGGQRFMQLARDVQFIR